MKYNFDQIIDRKNTGSFKWDFAEVLYHEENLLPAWVADMDFKSPQPVIDAFKSIVDHGIFGYPICKDSYFDSVIKWMRRKHNFEVLKKWIVYSPGIVPALNMIINTFTKPGDNIIIQQPVYYPFMEAIKNNKCNIINNSLTLSNNKYIIDFDDFEQKASQFKPKLFILCSPHNPVGRVWTKEELVKLGNICLKNNILVISDEIHADLTFAGYKHIPFATISEEFLNNSITCTSASKTFNLAGLHTSNIIIANAEKRIAFNKTLQRVGIFGPNSFGAIALEAAYNFGEDWLNQLINYLQSNYNFLTDFFVKNIPGAKVIDLEATYLVWIDFRSYGLNAYELKNLLTKKAKVALSHGYVFGEKEGSGFVRINIATPRSTLQEILQRIKSVF